jgi:hypothetical protein
VAEIAFAEWTQNGLLRQPRFASSEAKDAAGVHASMHASLEKWLKERKIWKA